MPSDIESGAVLPPGTPCITRPGSDEELLQVAIQHPGQGWIAVEVTRREAAKLANELQSFADFRATSDVDA